MAHAQQGRAGGAPGLEDDGTDGAGENFASWEPPRQRRAGLDRQAAYVPRTLLARGPPYVVMHRGLPLASLPSPLAPLPPLRPSPLPSPLSPSSPPPCDGMGRGGDGRQLLHAMLTGSALQRAVQSSSMWRPHPASRHFPSLTLPAPLSADEDSDVEFFPDAAFDLDDEDESFVLGGAVARREGSPAVEGDTSVAGGDAATEEEGSHVVEGDAVRPVAEADQQVVDHLVLGIGDIAADGEDEVAAFNALAPQYRTILRNAGECRRDGAVARPSAEWELQDHAFKAPSPVNPVPGSRESLALIVLRSVQRTGAGAELVKEMKEHIVRAGGDPKLLDCASIRYTLNKLRKCVWDCSGAQKYMHPIPGTDLAPTFRFVATPTACTHYWSPNAHPTSVLPVKAGLAILLRCPDILKAAIEASDMSRSGELRGMYRQRAIKAHPGTHHHLFVNLNCDGVPVGRGTQRSVLAVFAAITDTWSYLKSVSSKALRMVCLGFAPLGLAHGVREGHQTRVRRDIISGFFKCALRSLNADRACRFLAPSRLYLIRAMCPCQHF